MTDSLRVMHTTLRNTEVTVIDRQVRFDVCGVSDPMDEDQYAVLLTVPGFEPLTEAEDGAEPHEDDAEPFEDSAETLPAEGEAPVAEEEWPFEPEGDGWFDPYQVLDVAGRIDWACSDEFTADHLLSLQDHEAQNKNSKKVIFALNDLIVRRTPNSSAADVNTRLMRAIVPQEVEE